MPRSLRAVGSENAAPDEVDLVARAIAGEQDAFAGLYKLHASYIAGVVTRTLGSDADLDDIVQETFVEGLRQLDSLHEAHKLRSFLVTIAVRRIYARMSLRYRMKSLASQLFGITPAVSNPAAAERVHSLYELLSKMRPRHRIAWVLHRVEGYTLPEVAAQVDTSLATVKRWIAQVDQDMEAYDATQ
jgi:RNA polymerase sigma-70 factor, ECF subfamily